MSRLLDDIDELLPRKAEVINIPTIFTEPPEIPQWSRFKPLFDEAMSGGLYTIGEVEQKIRDGRAVFFPGKSSAVIAEVVDYASKRIFQCTWACGDLDEILLMSDGIEAVGRSLGCVEMIIEGRKGWEKALASKDYKPWSVTLVKGL